MEWYHITFRSITPAQGAERLLRKSGIDAALMRAVRQISAEGCGYSLRIRSTQGQKALELLKSKGVPFKRVFFQGDNGDVTELAP